MTELEQIKEDVINAESNAQSARIRLEEYEQGLAAQELPEVWYLHALGGWHFPAGCDAGDEGAVYFGRAFGGDTTTSEPSNRTRASLDADDCVERSTKSKNDNAYSLLFGADFTGRLDQIDVPVCELNKATRDEMTLYQWNEFEWHDGDGGWRDDNSAKRFDHTKPMQATFVRLRAPKMRTMTRKEVLAWASSADAFGWVVRTERLMGDYYPPQCVTYGASVDSYQRAQIATLNDDGTGGEWEAFEVAV